MARQRSLLAAAALLALTIPAARSAAAAPSGAGEPASRDARALRFEREILATQLELARRGGPYFQIDAAKGELRLLVSGIVLSQFPSEKHLIGGRLRRALARRDTGSPLLRPFRWVGLDSGDDAGGPGSLSLRLDPTLRVEFEASPSDFFWRWLRFNLGDRFGGGKGDAGMSLVLFYQPDSLAAFAPLLSDSLDVILLPSGF